MAGESARDVARRQREKAERLNKSAERWEKGAAGEQATARALAMLPTTWRVLHDVRWPGRRYANIDHIVVGPPGVFVIDSKAWSGDVTLRDGVLRCGGYSKEREVAGAADSALAVAEAVPGLTPDRVHPVICLVREEDFGGIAREVSVCTTANLVTMLTSQPATLPPHEVGPLQGRVSWAMTQARRPLARPSGGRRPPPVPTPVRRGGAGRLLGRVLVVGMVGIVALVGISMVVALLSSIGHSIGEAQRSSTNGGRAAGAGGGDVTLTLGQAGVVPKGTNRPPLRIRADHFVTTRSLGDAPYVVEGNRIVAVRVTIQNLGRRAWVSQPGTQILLKTDTGIPHRVSFDVATVAGPGLAEVMRVQPGRKVVGNAVFQVSQSSPVAELDITVGPGQPAGLAWTIDRQ